MTATRTILLRAGLFAVLLVGAVAQPGAFAQDAAIDPAVEWRKLQTEYNRAFTALPIKRLFPNPMKELQISRRAPFTKAARAEIDKRRSKERVLRTRFLLERAKRDDIVRRIGALGGDRAAALLMRTWESQLSNIDIAQQNLDRFVEANSIDINPGVDPGGVYWQRWMNKSEVPAARNALQAEKAVKDLALELSVKSMTPEIKDWLAEHAQGHEREWVREEMITALANSRDTENIVALGRILEGEPEVWARVTIVLALGESKAPGSEVFVLRALGDEAWPVRSAAIAALRTLGLRDTAAVDALVARVEADDGQLRLEARQALAEATGEEFGLEPAEWRSWWDGARLAWKEPAAPTRIQPYADGLPHFCGSATASKRIVFVVSHGKRMAEPVKRRSRGNDGTPSGGPAVDTEQLIAAWELGETLASLPEDARFTVIVFGDEPSLWSKRLRPPTKDARDKAVRFVRKTAPAGASRLAGAMDAALRLGVGKKVKDLALAGVGDVDTIFVVGGNLDAVGSLGGPSTRGKDALARVRRLRRVRVLSVRPGVK